MCHLVPSPQSFELRPSALKEPVTEKILYVHVVREPLTLQIRLQSYTQVTSRLFMLRFGQNSLYISVKYEKPRSCNLFQLFSVGSIKVKKKNNKLIKLTRTKMKIPLT